MLMILITLILFNNTYIQKQRYNNPNSNIWINLFVEKGYSLMWRLIFVTEMEFSIVNITYVMVSLHFFKASVPVTC